MIKKNFFFYLVKKPEKIGNIISTTTQETKLGIRSILNVTKLGLTAMINTAKTKKWLYPLRNFVLQNCTFSSPQLS